MGELLKAMGTAVVTMPPSQRDRPDHRRGTYPTVATGLSYGGGAKVSVRLSLGSSAV